MWEFADIARIVKASDEGGSWSDLTLLHGAAFALGFIFGELAFLASRWVGRSAVVGAICYLAHLVTPSASIVFSFVYPPAWIAWGVVFVGGWRLVKSIWR